MTPYRKELRASEAANFFPARGFVYVEVDARGTGGSQGQYNGVFLTAEQNDGYDAIEWLATKYPSCDGKVGMWGGSYSGINQYLSIHSPSTAPWTRNDVYALNALKGQFVGQGGGDEARRSQFLGGLRQRLGAAHGMSVFNDLRQFKNPESPTSVDGNFNYGHIPNNPSGSAILDPGSFQPTPSVASADVSAQAPREPTRASNTLMIDADHSNTGHPLMVGGPQIGYFYPGLTYEIDCAPGLDWRGRPLRRFPATC
jgi:acyl-homoserine lactone acylase PvdQ